VLVGLAAAITVLAGHVRPADAPESEFEHARTRAEVVAS
jgi:hypothetical protein